MKNFTQISSKMKTALLMLAALFTFNAAFAETGSETEKEQRNGNKNTTAEGQSYTIDGTYIAGTGSGMADPMTSKGLKFRTAQNGGSLEFTVRENYTITRLYMAAVGNYAKKDAEGEHFIYVTKVEVDDVEVPFTGGDFPAKGAEEAAELTIENINATQRIVIYFDNTNAEGTQINASWVIDWSRPDADKPTITVSPEAITLIPGYTYQLSAHVDPASFTTAWSSSNEAVATVDENGLVTAVAPGTAEILNAWTDNASENGKAVITVSTFNESALTVVKKYDFTSMESQNIELAEEAAGSIWNEVNNKVNPVMFCTTPGLEDIALQMVTTSLERGGKGWLILNNYTDDTYTEPTNFGLFLATGAGRCAAIGNLKAGQIVEINYTGAKFYTKDHTVFADDAGVTKTALNEGVGRAIYQVQEDGMLGFEIEKGNSVTSIIVYESNAVTGISDVQQQAVEGAVFNALGQQVKKAAKGLNIQNGKKFIVK